MTFPEFFEHAPMVRVHDPLAQLLGSATDGIMDYHYADVVRLASHSCPTVAGAFLTARAALTALYPDSLPERGGIAVQMPSPENEGTTGVVAQVLTLITGAAAQGGFKGIGGNRYSRNGLLSFAEQAGENSGFHGGTIGFERLDTGAAVMVTFDANIIPADPSQRERMQAVIQNRETPEQQVEFARLWQERVRCMLLEHADDPEMIKVVMQD